MHTDYSLCSILKPETILKIAKKRGLNGIAVTDHNTIKGGLAVKRLNKDRDFEVIVGSETSTNRGHLIGLYLNKEIKTRDFEEAVHQIHKQGGLAIIAHPFRFFPSSRFKKTGININCLDGIECINGRTFFTANTQAKKLAEKNNMAKTAGSDAHFPFEIGQACTIFDDDLKEALKKRKTKLEYKSCFGIIGRPLSSINKLCAFK